MAWFFSKKNRINNSQELQKSKWLEEAVGKVVVCHDRKERRVFEIVHSHQYPWFAIINEKDPDSNAGHFISYFSLTSQLINKYVPTKDEDENFIKLISRSKTQLRSASGLPMD